MANAFSLTLLFFSFGTAISEDVATYAISKAGSTHWSFANSYVTDTYTAYSNTNKSHLFVYDVLTSCNVYAPRSYGMHGCGGMNGWMHGGMMRGCYRPISPSDWGNMQCQHMNPDINCWVSHDNNYNRQLGDIISDGVRVAIVTGNSLSTSADEYEIVENDWGFRYQGEGSYESITACWHYNC